LYKRKACLVSVPQWWRNTDGFRKRTEK